MKKNSRGRLGQFKVLYEEKKLHHYLVETVLFSKESLFHLLEKYKAVILKPSFGPGNLIISLENNKYKIKAQKEIVFVNDKEGMYQYISQYEIKQKYYIVQPYKLLSTSLQTPYKFFVTVHRKSPSAKWSIDSVTENEDTSVYKKLFHKFLFRKYRTVSILAAKKLGKSFPGCNTIVVEIATDFKTSLCIYDTVLHFPISKWDQYQTLRANRKLGPFVPNTNLLTHATFSDYINKFNEIIIKPCTGQNGLGIIQIIRKNPFSYEIHSGITTITKMNIDESYSYIKEICLSTKDYVIQRKIQLATIDDCPIDIRVITQKIESTWSVTGKLAKVAGKNFIITNAAQKLLPFEKAIYDSSITSKSSGSLEYEIEELCITAAKKLEENNIKIKIIGFDIGITDAGGIWIIEGNYIPDLSMFKEYEDPQLYMNMLNIRNRNIKISRG